MSGVLVYAFFDVTGRFPVYAEHGTAVFILNLFFVQDETGFNVPAWSLSVEALMYVLFYVAARHGRLVEFACLCVTGGLAVILAYGHADYWASTPININILRGLIGFFFGVLINRVERRNPLSIVCPLIIGGVLPALVIARTYPFGVV